jgi:hypothetical protein
MAQLPISSITTTGREQRIDDNFTELYSSVDTASATVADLASAVAVLEAAPAIDGTGHFLVNTATDNTEIGQVSATFVSDTGGALQLIRAANDVPGVQLAFAKTRSTTHTTFTTVQQFDFLGAIDFFGADGTDLVRAARILVSVDDTIGSGSVPGSIGFYTRNNTLALQLDHNQSVLAYSATGGLGYGAGAGGSQTQLTNKSTSVELNTVCGAITMSNATCNANTTVSFTLTNSAINNTDVMVLNHASGGTAGSYALNAQCGAGSASINVRNITAGNLAEAIVIRFALVRSDT